MELDRLTIKSQTALQEAHQQAAARHHQQIEPEHAIPELIETDHPAATQPIPRVITSEKSSNVSGEIGT